MKRLTKRLSTGRVIIRENVHATNVNESEENFNHARACLEKLAAYEDAEEDGRLIMLPCKEGTTVYCLRYDTYTDANGEEWTICDNRRRHIEERKFFESMRKDIGKNTFLTHEEAEAALAVMKE